MKRKSKQIARFLILLLSILLIIASMSVNVFAADTIIDSGACGEYGDNVVWEFDEYDTLTISGTGAMADYEYVEEVPWYGYMEFISDVVVTNGVTHVGEYAFADCEELFSLTLSNSVTSIGDYALENNSSVERVYASSIESWLNISFGDLSFPRNYKLYLNGRLCQNPVIPDSVNAIGKYAFSCCQSITSIDLGNNVTDIGSYAFAGCYGLTSVDLPDSVTTIWESAFMACNNIASITVPEGIQDICMTAFYGCNNLKTVFYNGTKAQRESIVIDEYNEPLEDALWHYNADEGVHAFKTTTTKATTSANGKKVTKCAACGTIKSTKTIYKVSSVKLSASKYTYNGEKKTPIVTVKDSKGNKLVKGEDYKVTYSSSKRTAIGRYSVKVTFMGDYSGSKTLYFTIGPKNPSTVNAKLYGHDDVKVSWKKVSGASGYRVYYKKSTSDTWKYKTTTGTSIKLANLSDGAKYNIKVSAYKTVNGNKYFSTGKTVNIYTLKKISDVEVVKSSSKVKVSWDNISGETGYQISKSTSKTGTNIVATYKTTSGGSKTVSATADKAYYYKVRAYKVVDGKKIYGPWSTPVKFVRKSKAAELAPYYKLAEDAYAYEQKKQPYPHSIDIISAEAGYLDGEKAVEFNFFALDAYGKNKWYVKYYTYTPNGENIASFSIGAYDFKSIDDLNVSSIIN